MLGKGGYGTVFKATRLDTGDTVALKAVRKALGGAHADGMDAGLHGARVERDVLAAIEHPFVIRMHSVPHAHPSTPPPSLLPCTPTPHAPSPVC